jgi:hypothetical protein
LKKKSAKFLDTDPRLKMLENEKFDFEERCAQLAEEKRVMQASLASVKRKNEELIFDMVATRKKWLLVEEDRLKVSQVLIALQKKYEKMKLAFAERK